MNSTTKTRLSWISLILSSLTLATLAIFSVYREHSTRAKRQSELLQLHQETLVQQLSAYFAQIKLQSARQLIAFHEEGLHSRLTRWKDSNPLILEATIAPSNASLLQELPPQNIELIDLDSPDTPSSLRSGFYLDNKEIAAYEHGAANPILLWELRPNDQTSSWHLSHRLAPDSQIRAASLSNEELAHAFNRFIAQTASPSFNAAVEPAGRYRSLKNTPSAALSQLPGYTITITERGNGYTPWFSISSAFVICLCLILGSLCIGLIYRQTKKEREEALQKTNFVSQIGHEFKTPLTSISLYAELLAENESPDLDRPKLLKTISRESHRLGDLVDNILALNALEKGKKQHRLQSIDASEAIDSVVQDYSASFSQHGIQLDWTRSESQTPVKFDPANLRQIILNLFDNARKYAAETKKISIRVQSSNTHYTISITDYGPGIPEADAKKIFEPFYQKSSTLTDKSPGVGIGLSLSRRLARECGGDLTLDKKYKQGARFLIHLPK